MKHLNHSIGPDNGLSVHTDEHGAEWWLDNNAEVPELSRLAIFGGDTGAGRRLRVTLQRLGSIRHQIAQSDENRDCI